jgi:PAS domain S-box-containing protein
MNSLSLVDSEMLDIKPEDRSHLLNAILDGLSFSVWVIDTSYRLIYYNSVFKDRYLSGYDVSLDIGREMLHDLTANEQSQWKAYYDRALSGQTFFVDIDELQVAPDMTFRAYLRPYFSADGIVIGCIVSTENTTEFSRIISKLRSDERKLESILNNTDDIIMLIDKEMTILHFNHGLSLLVENRWGIQMKSGIHVSEVMEPQYAKSHLKYYERGLAGERFSQIEEYVNPFGDPVFIETSYNPVFEDDGSVNSLAIHSRDITLRQIAAIDLIKSKERAEELNRLKTNFLANMSHEIRTPINGILGLAEIMADETDINNIKEYTLYLRESGRRLLNTITSILDISKLEAEGANIKLESVILGHVVHDVLEMLHPIAKMKGIFIDVVSDTGNHTVLADRTMMHQIFTNLIGNAVKFTHEGGVSIEIGMIKSPGFIVVTVEDTGVGISEEFLPKVFDAFEQESSGTKRAFEGSGLGLSITKKFINLIGGSITVSSKKNVGSTFEVRLPTYKLDH